MPFAKKKESAIDKRVKEVESILAENRKFAESAESEFKRLAELYQGEAVDLFLWFLEEGKPKTWNEVKAYLRDKWQEADPGTTAFFLRNLEDTGFVIGRISTSSYGLGDLGAYVEKIFSFNGLSPLALMQGSTENMIKDASEVLSHNAEMAREVERAFEEVARNKAAAEALLDIILSEEGIEADALETELTAELGQQVSNLLPNLFNLLINQKLISKSGEKYVASEKGRYIGMVMALFESRFLVVYAKEWLKTNEENAEKVRSAYGHILQVANNSLADLLLAFVLDYGKAKGIEEIKDSARKWGIESEETITTYLGYLSSLGFIVKEEGRGITAYKLGPFGEELFWILDTSWIRGNDASQILNSQSAKEKADALGTIIASNAEFAKATRKSFESICAQSEETSSLLIWLARHPRPKTLEEVGQALGYCKCMRAISYKLGRLEESGFIELKTKGGSTFAYLTSMGTYLSDIIKKNDPMAIEEQ